MAIVHGKLTVREILSDDYLPFGVSQVVNKTEDALVNDLKSQLKKHLIDAGDYIEDIYVYIPPELEGVTVKQARGDADIRAQIEAHTGEDPEDILTTLLEENGAKSVLKVFKTRWPQPGASTDSYDETVVILTALEVEFEAVRAHLDDPQEDQHHRGSVYDVGTYEGKKKRFRVAIKEIGPRNAGSGAEIERAIEYFEPKYVFFVGIAGGLKDVAIGDVVCASKVYGYESGKDTDKGFKTRPVAFVPSAAILERARAVKRASNRGQAEFKVYEGAIAAGEKVVTSRKSATAQLLTDSYGDSLAVAMEEVGFLEGAHKSHIEAMVIRGISDLLDNKSSGDEAARQRLASANAAKVAFLILDDLG